MEWVKRVCQESLDPSEWMLFEQTLELGTKARKAFRINTLKISEDRLLSLIQKAGWGAGFEKIPWQSAAYYFDPTVEISFQAHPLLGAGLVYIQEPSAMEAVSVLKPKSGAKVLDLCASPGGKSTQILEYLNGGGELWAFEVNSQRAHNLNSLLARHGSQNLRVLTGDPWALLAESRGSFDCILVDAPCSGESLFVRRDEKRKDVKLNEVQRLSKIQLDLLQLAALLLKPEGRLLYSTCTFERTENEEVIEEFLLSHPEFHMIQSQRRWPHKERGVAGGYYCLLEKKESGANSAPERFSNKLFEIRRGFEGKDLEMCAYAKAMSSGVTPNNRLELNDLQARNYLKGEAIVYEGSLRGVHTMFWQGYPLGLGKIVEGRVNNLLPKMLR